MREDIFLKKYNRVLNLLILLALFSFAFLVYRGTRLTGLYMDDLYMWSCFGEQSFREFVFPIGSTRCRFVYWFLTWLELGFIKNHIDWIVPINILMSGCIAAFIYAFAKKLSSSRWIGFFAGILYLSSRFSYYQVSQLLGPLEGFALFFALVICYMLYKYIEATDSSILYYIGALITYFLVCFTHERYMVLLPMFFYVLIVKRSKDIRLWVAPVAVFAIVQLIRFFMIGSVLPAGTGGTYVAETITVTGVIKNIITQAAYLLGVNAPDEYLSGISWANTAAYIKLPIIIEALLIIGLIFMGAVSIIKDKSIENITKAVLFIGFIIGCVVAAAVTIRVEMRWVYISYVLLLLLASFMYGIILKKDGMILKISFAFFVLYAILGLATDLYYRNYQDNIYLYQNQKRYNSLADITYNKYGDGIWGKKIYIIGNSYNMSDFTKETFFKTFDKTRTGSGTEVILVESAREIGQVDDNMLVLQEDPSTDTYIDITRAIKTMRCETIYGYYSDGWMDKEAELYVAADKDGNISFDIMYPGNMTGSEALRLTVDDADTLEYKLQETNVKSISLTYEPYSIHKLDFSYNFIMPNAMELRGDTPLAAVVEFK